MESKADPRKDSPREGREPYYAKPSNFLTWVKNTPPKDPRPIPTPAPPRPKKD